MASSHLPDDLMMDYDLMQFVDSEDALAHDAGIGAGPMSGSTSGSGGDGDVAAFQFVNVDDFLSNSDMSMEAFEATLPPVAASAQSHAASQGHEANRTAPTATNNDSSTLLDDLLVNGDDLVSELLAASQATATTTATTTTSSTTATATATASMTSFLQSAYEMDSLTDVDVDVTSSPTPSSSHSDGFCYSPSTDHTMEDVSMLLRTESGSLSAASTPTGRPTLVSGSSSLDEATEGEENDDNGTSDSSDEDIAADTDIDKAKTADIQHNVDLMQKEAKYLEAQYDYLLSRSRSSRAARTSIKARRRLRDEQKAVAKKTEDNSVLTKYVEKQSAYLENLRAMLAFAPVSDIRMALMTPIESYIHLGKDFDERRRTILDLREEKLDMTHKYIEEKSRGMDLNEPYRYSDVFERFGKYYTVNFAVSKYEGVQVGQVVKVVYDQMAGKDDSLVQAMGCLSIRESYDSIKCNFLHQRIVSSLKWAQEFDEGMPDMETNSLFLCRFAGDTAVFATDYIDKDDLHPYESNDRIRKDVSSGVVLTSHTDEDGKQSVIMKKFQMAKFHMYPHKISDELSNMLFTGVPAVGTKLATAMDERLADSHSGELPACQESASMHEKQKLADQAVATVV